MEKTITGDNKVERKKFIEQMGAWETMHNGDFAYYFADLFSVPVQYGNRTGLCDLIKDI